jgi:hypothetical protein
MISRSRSERCRGPSFRLKAAAARRLAGPYARLALVLALAAPFALAAATQNSSRNGAGALGCKSAIEGAAAPEFGPPCPQQDHGALRRQEPRDDEPAKVA